MKKLVLLTVLMGLISGCETSAHAYNMYQQGSAGFSCNDINKAFSAYKRDRNSNDGLAVLVPLMASAGGVNTASAGTTSDAYYEQAKSAANIGLMVQGCPVIY